MNHELWNTKIKKDPKKIEDDWNKNLKKVLTYIKNHKDHKQPIGTDKTNCGGWWNEQKKSYIKGKMSEDRKEKIDKNNLINQLHWNVGSLKEYKWIENFNILLEYIENDENHEIPTTRDSKNKGRWLDGQKNQYKHGNMSNNRKKC